MKRHIALATLAMTALPLIAQADDDEALERLEAQTRELSERLEALADALESGAGASADPSYDLPHAPTGKVLVGGYGSMKYQSLEKGKKMDFHRFVLYFGKRFNDLVRFESELELEHSIAGDGKPGAIELEQAYLAFDFSPDQVLTAGMFLIPAGIVNETHEPTTFYGVYRPVVEKYIIPTTWYEGGLMYTQRFAGGWSVDLALHSGLETTAADGYAIRPGRNRIAQAPAESLASTARLKWTGMPGVELAATVQRQGDLTQGTENEAVSALFFTSHAILQKGPFGVRALYAEWRLDGAGPAASGADRQRGWYLEPAFKPNEHWGFFVRYETWNNQAGDNGGSDKKQGNVGVNYWPHPDVVFKAEYQNRSGSADDGFLLGLGYRL